MDPAPRETSPIRPAQAGSARVRPRTRPRFAYYTGELFRLLRLHIPAGSTVLEIGIRQDGDLLAALSPTRGLGLDPDPDVVAASRARHPHLTFARIDPASFDPAGETFDYIVISNALATVKDVQALFTARTRPAGPRPASSSRTTTRSGSRPSGLATLLRLRARTGPQNWLSVQDLANLLAADRPRLVRKSTETLLPLRLPLLAGICNRFLVRFWPFTHFGLVSVLIARAAGQSALPVSSPGDRRDPLPQRAGQHRDGRAAHARRWERAPRSSSWTATAPTVRWRRSSG